MADRLHADCAQTFRIISGLENSSAHFGWSDEKLLTEPLKALGVDSLTLLEFVMKVETDYNVELDEEEVSRCKTVADLVALVAAARNGAN